MVMPAAAGLFHRGIAQSVPNFLFGSDLAADVASVVAERLGLRSTVGDLTDVPPQALADATGGNEYQDRWGYPLAVRRSQFGPVIDGEILPDSPFRALVAGAGRGVDLLIGHNRDEYRYVVHENGGVVTAEQAERALDLLPPTPGGAQTYRAAYPRANHAELYELVCSDFVYRMPTLHIAQAHALGGGATHLYEFCFDASSFGAAHTTEIPLVFGTLDSPIGSALYGSAPQAEAVSREMSAAWRAFATDGDPGWPAYEPTEQFTRVFDIGSRTVRYPEQASQQIWSDYPFDPFALSIERGLVTERYPTPRRQPRPRTGRRSPESRAARRRRKRSGRDRGYLLSDHWSGNSSARCSHWSDRTQGSPGCHPLRR